MQFLFIATTIISLILTVAFIVKKNYPAALTAIFALAVSVTGERIEVATNGRAFDPAIMQIQEVRVLQLQAISDVQESRIKVLSENLAFIRKVKAEQDSTIGRQDQELETLRKQVQSQGQSSLLQAQREDVDDGVRAARRANNGKPSKSVFLRRSSAQ